MKNLKNFAIALIVLASLANQSFAQETATLKTRTKSNQSNERSSSNITPAPKEIDAYQILKTKSAQGQHIKQAVLTCRVIPTETGFTIAFDNVGGITGGVVAGKKGYDYYQNRSCFSVSSADNSVTRTLPLARGHAAASTKSLNKGREASSPSVSEIVVTKSAVQESLSSGMGAGKATFKEFTVTKRCDGKTTKISCPDGECDIPLDDCPNGACDLVCEWSWGMSNSGSMSSGSGAGSGRCAAGFSLEIQDGACTAMAINEKGLPGGSSKKEKK